MICKILGVFVKTLNVGDKYCLLNRENLTTLIQMELSVKKNSFSELVSAFFKSTLNFENFQEKHDRYS